MYEERLNQHISFVREAGRKIGADEDLLRIHDASKWSSEEFDAYALYFARGADASPVDASIVGDKFVKAWLHHIHHNPHHWQYWIFPDGYSPKDSTVENGCVEMPACYALEMVADWMGASKAYTGSWDMTDWLCKNMARIRVHSNTAKLIRNILDQEGYADTVYLYRFAGETT